MTSKQASDRSPRDAAPPPSPPSRSTFRTIVGCYAPYTASIAVVLVMMLLQAAYNVALAWATRVIFDRCIAARNATLLAVVVGALVAGFLLRLGVVLVQERIVANTSTRAVRDLRERMFEKLLRLSTGYFVSTPAGDVVARFSTDLSTVETLLLRIAPKLAYLTIVVVSCAAMLFVFDVRLAILTVLAQLVAFSVPRALAKRAAAAAREEKREEVAALATVQETIATQSIIKLFGLFDWRLKGYRAQLQAQARKSANAVYAGVLVESATTLASNAVQILVIGVGAYIAIRAGLSVGSLFGFVGLLALITNATFGLSSLFPLVISAGAALSRIEDFLAEPSTTEDLPDARSVPRLAREIRFEHVRFSYTSEREDVRDVSFAIRAGESVAFVGPSGSGKSTMLALLLRHYDPTGGTITMDGIDTRSIRLASLREQIAVVPQEPLLFSLSVRENIRLGNLGATDAQIEAAARDAEVHDLIVSWPRGYETPVGERGGTLSGGQRQRLAIARALVRDPAILVLDEATSALDAATERAICETLERVGKGRTVVSVTHRLSSVRSADRIFVIDAGQLVEQGSHDDLLARNGTYHKLWSRQSGLTVDRRGLRAAVTPSILAEMPLLSAVDAEGLANLAKRFVTLHFRAGEIVFEEGEEGDLFYLIVRGAVEFTKRGESRARVLRDGDYFGELALLDDAPRSGTVRAVAPTILLGLEAAQFAELLDERPNVRESVERVATARRLSNETVTST